MAKRKNRELKEDLRAIRKFKRDKNRKMISEKEMKNRLMKSLTFEEKVKLNLIKNGLQIRDIRKKRKMTQYQLAKKAGLSVRTIRIMESGNFGYMKVFTVIKVIVALKATIKLVDIKHKE